MKNEVKKQIALAKAYEVIFGTDEYAVISNLEDVSSCSEDDCVDSYDDDEVLQAEIEAMSDYLRKMLNDYINDVQEANAGA